MMSATNLFHQVKAYSSQKFQEISQKVSTYAEKNPNTTKVIGIAAISLAAYYFGAKVIPTVRNYLPFTTQQPAPTNLFNQTISSLSRTLAGF